MKTIIKLFLYLFIPTALLSQDLARQLAALLDEISAAHIRQHVKVLGSDQMQGRATGSLGERLAAEYIRSQLESNGIAPAAGRRSYFQNIPFHGSTPLPGSELLIHENGAKNKLELGRDYVLYNTGVSTTVPQPLPLVFVGYGIVAPEFDYNDYHNVDVAGKIVVYLSGEPESDDANFFAGALPTVYSNAAAKERLAISRGAQGTVLISNSYSWDRSARGFSFENVRLAYDVTHIFSALLNPNAAVQLFHNAPHSLEEVLKWPQKRYMTSFELNTRLSFHGRFRERDFFSKNVIAEVQGTDPHLRESYLLLSAHYDHLGIGVPVRGDSIYNGVVDNAIGTAALLEMARALKRYPPKRSVLFLFLTGEEKGALGSTFYVDNPVVPLYKSIANINCDGLAIFDTFRDVIGFGAELSTMEKTLQKSAALLGLSVSPLPERFSKEESFARSDQIIFAKAGIPATIVMDGVNYDHMDEEAGIRKHIYWMNNIYHSPFDDLQQPINWLAAEQHCQLLLTFAWELANDMSEPQWNARAPYLIARLQSIAEKR